VVLSDAGKVRALVTALSLALPAGCGRHDGVDGAPTASAESPATIQRRASAIQSIEAAEWARASAKIADDSLADHDPAVRRAAARAFARILDTRALSLLPKALADEDDEVVAWSAYGLGAACPLGDARTVRVLVARLAALEDAPGVTPKEISARPAIFDALARCGSDAAEGTLRAVLSAPGSARESAALSLGRLAARQHRLDDPTVVALLEAATAASPVHGALAAFGQLDTVPAVSVKRLVQVAERAIRDGGRERGFGIAALLPAGAAGADTLAAVLTEDKLPASARSLAASTLGRIGKAAQAALHTAVAHLVPASIDAAFLDREYAPLAAALPALDPPAQDASDALGRLAELPIAEGAPPSVVHRSVALRCAAAAVLAGSSSQAARLVHCDPDAKGREGALAVIRVLDRGQLAGARRKIWAEYSREGAPGVRRAALSLLPRHLEAAPVIDELVQALGAKEPGVVAQAARALADAPRLAGAHGITAPPDGAKSDEAPAPKLDDPSRAVVDALARAMDAERPADQIETRVALAAAAASVGALSLRARLERYCASPNVTVRRGAESALRSLGASAVTCDGPSPTVSATDRQTNTRAVTLTFVTDAGRLGMTLDPSLAPLAVTRIVELAKKGFYDGMPILRVSPGYVVQLGDSTGDGSGGAGAEPVPSEGAPVEFGAFAVGLALGGRDSGSSQLFVTLGEQPALFGDYPRLGSADPEWGSVAEGDVIAHVEVRP
jgi:cyclophilin family peptidyl-prolyl cis-trans isomerase